MATEGVFGSVARGEHNANSDLDVFVDIEDPDYFILCDIQEDLQSLCNCKVDLVRMRKDMEPILHNNILHDGIVA